MAFRREEGEGGSAQRWVDANLPTCPLCRTQSLWETAEGSGDLASTRWLFRCPTCGAVFSMPPEVRAAAVAEPVTVVKVPLAVLLRIDSVQRSQDEDFVGEEFPLNELQEWASERQD